MGAAAVLVHSVGQTILIPVLLEDYDSFGQGIRAPKAKTEIAHAFGFSERKPNADGYMVL